MVIMVKGLGLIVKPGIKAAADLSTEIIAWAKNHGLPIWVDAQTEKLLIATGSMSPLVSTTWIEEMPKSADIIVTLGGDGTLIGVARYVETAQTKMVGVNFGTLGFLTEIRPEELIDVLEKTKKGTSLTGTRSMLHVQAVAGAEESFSSNALNDVVIHKGTKDRLLELDVLIDGNPLARVRADGLILSTPTGSTAYSLAAGGSIVHPEIPVTLLTPICAHSLTMRPLVFGSHSKVEISFPPYDGEILITVDGQVSQGIKSNSIVRITEANTKVTFVRSPSRSYFDVLTAKLNWGIPNRAN